MMPDETERLQHAVSELRKALEANPALPDTSRQMLEQALSDVCDVLEQKKALDSTGEVPQFENLPLRKQLQETAAEFEGDHPTLGGTLRSVIDALAQLGI